ncbi:MAG: hypothetical protein INR73_03115 [Williamsia sp.]|nr:hypothetical protein [Williamsia sp.]
MITIFIHLFLFVYIIILINKYKNIFKSASNGIPDYDTVLTVDDANALQQNSTQNKLFDAIVAKANQFLEMDFGNKLINHTQQIDKIVSQALYQARLSIIANMSWHIVVSFFFIASYYFLEISSSSFSAASYFNDLHVKFAFFLCFSMITIEVFWLLSAMQSTEENKGHFLNFISLKFFNHSQNDLAATLQAMTGAIHAFNDHFQTNTMRLKENLDVLTTTSDSLNALVSHQVEYQQLIQKLNIDEIIIRNGTFYQDVKKSMEEASGDLSQFSNLASMLNATLNRSIVLYKELNRVIERDGRFADGFKEFNQNFKDSGHLTTQLVQSLNQIKTHLDQVVLTHAPKIEELDERFFVYLQKRLDTFKVALQKNDELILQAIDKRYGTIKD